MRGLHPTINLNYNRTYVENVEMDKFYFICILKLTLCGYNVDLFSYERIHIVGKSLKCYISVADSQKYKN
jgi:hypothetical protein